MGRDRGGCPTASEAQENTAQQGTVCSKTSMGQRTHSEEGPHRWTLETELTELDKGGKGQGGREECHRHTISNVKRPGGVRRDHG